MEFVKSVVQATAASRFTHRIGVAMFSSSWKAPWNGDGDVASPLLLGAQEAPQHFFAFLPLPQGQGSLRPTLGAFRTMGVGAGGGVSIP